MRRSSADWLRAGPVPCPDGAVGFHLATAMSAALTPNSAGAFPSSCCCSGSPSPALPASVTLWNSVMTPLGKPVWSGELLVRDVSLLWRAIIALTIGYGAFIAEVFPRRHPVRSSPARSRRLRRSVCRATSVFRLIVFPQAMRTILLPLGNEFVTMVKDSSFVSVLGGRRHHPNGENLLGRLVPLLRDLFDRRLYLPAATAVSLSLMLRALEQRMRRAQR